MTIEQAIISKDMSNLTNIVRRINKRTCGDCSYHKPLGCVFVYPNVRWSGAKACINYKDEGSKQS